MREHNEKFNNMLVEQMTAQEELKKTMGEQHMKELKAAQAVAHEQLEKARSDLTSMYTAKIEGINSAHEKVMIAPPPPLQPPPDSRRRNWRWRGAGSRTS